MQALVYSSRGPWLTDIENEFSLYVYVARREIQCIAGDGSAMSSVTTRHRVFIHYYRRERWKQPRLLPPPLSYELASTTASLLRLAGVSSFPMTKKIIFFFSGQEYMVFLCNISTRPFLRMPKENKCTMVEMGATMQSKAASAPPSNVCV